MHIWTIFLEYIHNGKISHIYLTLSKYIYFILLFISIVQWILVVNAFIFAGSRVQIAGYFVYNSLLAVLMWISVAKLTNSGLMNQTDE